MIKRLFLFITIYLLQCLTVDAAELKSNPLWKHYKLEYFKEFQIKRNKVDSLIKSNSFDLLINDVIKDTTFTNCLTDVELFQIKTILYGSDFLNNKFHKDLLFITPVNDTFKKNKNDFSPYDRLIYSRANKDTLILHLYDQFHNVIDSLQLTNNINKETYLFYKAVFPVDSISYDSLMNTYENILKSDTDTQNVKLIYKYCYNRGKWNKFGILFGIGISLHWFGGDGASYFEPNLAFNMLNIDIYIKGIAIKSGINFTGHGNYKELLFQEYRIPANASLNFSEIFLAGGYCFSLKDKYLITPYLGFSNVFNNFPTDEVEKQGFDPSIPNIHAIKYGLSSYYNFSSSESIQSILMPGAFYITFDFSIEHYNLKHIGVPHNTPKYFGMIGCGALIGKKVKNNIL